MTIFDADLCRDGERHDWQPDPERRGEGYVCAGCGLSEAELAGDDDDE